MELIVQEILDDVWEVRKGSARDMGNEVGYSVWLVGGGGEGLAAVSICIWNTLL